MIGGYIEIFPKDAMSKAFSTFVLICDEEGQFCLDKNDVISKWMTDDEDIFGDIIICRCDNNENMISLSDNDVKYLKENFLKKLKLDSNN